MSQNSTEKKGALVDEETVAIKHRKKKKLSVLEKRNKRLKTRIRVLTALLSVFFSLSILYTFIVYTNIPFIKYWRTMWIETAMTTKSHWWLAEWFFPESIVNEIVELRKEEENKEVVGGKDNLEKPAEKPQEKPVIEDILGQHSMIVGGKDYAGNTVLINDIEEGLVVSEIVGPSYKGQIMLIDDPSRVYVGMTQYPGVTGMRILEMMDHYGAVAGVNASGFKDYDENGNGGEVVGMSVSQGKYWGEYAWHYGSILLTNEDKLVVGNVYYWQDYGNVRDGMQFSPVLIADGEKKVSGSSGYGIQPRTAVGQREDGVIAFLVIDGRNVTHSIGCTVDDMANELLKYGIINASSCDGGATTALAYKGTVLNKNCSLNPTLGRILPNAFLVSPKAEDEK